MKPSRTGFPGARVVYTTGGGRLCAGCDQAAAACRCALLVAARPSAPGAAVRVARQTQGRRGKGVTVVSGLGLAPAALEALARELKQRCGSGGRVVAGTLEIQGEHRDLLVAELARRGITAKRAGG